MPLEQIRHLLTGRPTEMVSGVVARQKVAGSVQLFQAKGLFECLIQGIVDASDAATSEEVASRRVDRLAIRVGAWRPRHTGVQDRIEDIEDEVTALVEMAMDGGEAGALLVRRGQMLKGAEWDKRQRELLVQFKRRDVGLDQVNGVSMRFALLSGGIQHTFRAIQPDDVMPRSRQRPCDVAGADAKFENRAAEALGAVEIKGNVAADLPIGLLGQEVVGNDDKVAIVDSLSARCPGLRSFN